MSIRCYFDDSGTHNGSKVAVWGGVIGIESRFAKFEKAWRARLDSPLEGKPPIRKFSLSSCAGSKGEFLGYSDGERDHLRFLFRKIIAEAKLYPLTYAVAVDDWDAKVNAKMRRRHGTADAAAFMACASAAITFAAKQPVRHALCVFDKGQLHSWQDEALSGLEKQALKAGVLVSYVFSPVAETPALQAADTIATEHYWDVLNKLGNPEHRPSAHMQSLLNSIGVDGYSLHAKEMANLRKRLSSESRLHVRAA